jgi:hypothetical protein
VSAKTEEIKIDGLPATRFIGRRVKAMLPDSVFTTVVCQGTFKKSVVVDCVVQGRTRQYHVSPKHVKPNWVENEDLQQEALALGVRYTGQVNVGRALEVAKEAAVKPEKPKPVPPPREDPPPLPQRCQEAVAAVEPSIEIPPPPLHTMPEEPTTVSKFAAITGVQASITADPTWVSDFSELQSLIAAGQGRRDRLEALRKEIQQLEGSEGDDLAMIELYVDALLQKGVTVQRDAPQQGALQVIRPGAQEKQLAKWLEATKPEQFTFEEALVALNASDSPVRRSFIRSVAVAAGYSVLPAACGRKLVFLKEATAHV